MWVTKYAICTNSRLELNTWFAQDCQTTFGIEVQTSCRLVVCAGVKNTANTNTVETRSFWFACVRKKCGRGARPLNVYTQWCCLIVANAAWVPAMSRCMWCWRAHNPANYDICTGAHLAFANLAGPCNGLGCLDCKQCKPSPPNHSMLFVGNCLINSVLCRNKRV